MRLARRMLAMGMLDAPSSSSAAERHYLQFDGVGDYAVADAVFGGISGDYTIAIKVKTPVSAGAAGSVWRYLTTGGAGLSATAQATYDRIYRTATQKAAAGGLVPSTGSVNFSAPTSSELATETTVLALKRTAAGSAKLRVVNSGGVVHTGDVAATMYKPDHICVAAAVSDSLVPQATTYASAQVMSVLLASAEVPDAELIAWLAADTAVGNLSSIDHYWAASDLSGSTIPARVGTVALTVSGPTTSDLVAL